MKLSGKIVWATALLITVTVFAGGCNWLGIVSYWVAGDQKTKVEAQYSDLQGKSFAVFVSADEHALFAQPNAREDVCHVVTRQLVQDINDVVPVDPRQIVEFQKNNPYWETLPYGDLLERLQIDRLIVIDLVTYTLHEPGNSHVWKGTIIAHVNVAEREATTANNMTFTESIQVDYPTDRPVGLLDVDESSFRLKLIESFARKVSNLFHDHEYTTPRI